MLDRLIIVLLGSFALSVGVTLGASGVVVCPRPVEGMTALAMAAAILVSGMQR